MNSAKPSSGIADQGFAKIQGMLISADQFFRDSENDTVYLEDQHNIQIIYQDQHIKAKKAVIRLKTKQIELTGDVEILANDSTVGGEKIILDYESNTGTIYQGYVKSGNVMFEGDILQRTSEREYYVSNAAYTSCTNCPAAWKFQGSEIRAELGGYAYIKSSLLKFGNVPVLWLPYLIVPLRSDRQSGLLTPEFETSERGGLAFSESFFYVISRSSDATFTLKNYEFRGPKSLLNFRNVLNESSYSEFNTGFLNDRVFKDDPRLNNNRPATQKGQYVGRWFVKYEHYLELPDGAVHRAQLNNASDLQYPKDFPTETLNHGDPAMENRVSVSKNSKDQHISFETSYYINLLHAGPLASNEDAVHRLPEINFAQMPRRISEDSGIFYQWDVNYTNFSRSGKAYDDLSTTVGSDGKKYRYVSNSCNSPTYENTPGCTISEDGVYNSSTDLIRVGQRLDINPSIYRPFTVGNVLDLVPKISYRETHYSFPVGQEPSSIRRYARAELTGKTSISAVFGDTLSERGTRYKHEIQPEVTLTTIPWLDHRSHPFFGFTTQSDAPNYTKDNVSDGDLGTDYGLQWDYKDRVYDRGLVTFSVLNKFIEKKWIGDQPIYKQFASFRLSQSYDAYQDSRNDGVKEPWSDIAAVLDLRLDNLETYSTINYFPYQKVANSSARVKFINDANQFLQVGLSQKNIIVAGQSTDPTARVEDYTISSGFQAKYFNFVGQFVYDANWKNATTDRRFKSWAYLAEFKPPGECWIITFIHDQVTGGDTNFRISFNFTFDGKYKSNVSPDALSSYGF